MSDKTEIKQEEEFQNIEKKTEMIIDPGNEHNHLITPEVGKEKANEEKEEISK